MVGFGAFHGRPGCGRLIAIRARIAAALSVVLACAGPAAANLTADGLFSFTEDFAGGFVRPVGDVSPIVFNNLATTYDTSTQVLFWEATFDPNPALADPGAALPDGFVLVINGGGDPTGQIGELATIFFDADTDPDDPIVTAYLYNGAASATSYLTSVDQTLIDNGTPPPAVPIVSSLNDPSFVQVAQRVENPDGTRTLRLQIDATAINDFVVPTTLLEATGVAVAAEYEGIGFAQSIGVWFHPYRTLAQYFEDGELSWTAAEPPAGSTASTAAARTLASSTAMTSKRF